nr:hypothetical protein [Gammaproteobacteria bacterium]
MKASLICRFFLSIPLILTSTLAFSQQEGEDEEMGGALEEVLVTATRRGEQDIMVTPVAITALTGETVDRFAVRDLNDMAVEVPGLSSGTVSAFTSA